MASRKNKIVSSVPGIVSNYDEANSKIEGLSVTGITADDISTVDIDVSGTANIPNITVSGEITGNLVGDVTGNVTGDLTGDVTGNVTGNVTGDVTGNVTGDLTGDVTGNVTIDSLLDVGNVENLIIDGGVAGQFLQTDGTGNLIFAGSSIANPAILNVSNDGSDTTGDGSITNPYATIQNALTVGYDSGISDFAIVIEPGSYSSTDDITLTGSANVAIIGNPSGGILPDLTDINFRIEATGAGNLVFRDFVMAVGGGFFSRLNLMMKNIRMENITAGFMFLDEQNRSSTYYLNNVEVLDEAGAIMVVGTESNAVIHNSILRNFIVLEDARVDIYDSEMPDGILFGTPGGINEAYIYRSNIGPVNPNFPEFGVVNSSNATSTNTIVITDSQLTNGNTLLGVNFTEGSSVQYRFNNILFDEANSLFGSAVVDSTKPAHFTAIDIAESAVLGNVENVVIEGGADGQVLTTDGSGNLSFADTVTTLQEVTDQGNITTNGITANGGFTGDLFGDVTGNVTIDSLLDVGNVENLIIDGGTDGQVLTTDGAGNISFADASTTLTLQEVTDNGNITTNNIEVNAIVTSDTNTDNTDANTIRLLGGNATGNSSDGGSIDIFGGDGTNDGGDIDIFGGDGGGDGPFDGGRIRIRSGFNSNGISGSVRILSGADGSTGFNDNPGYIRIRNESDFNRIDLEGSNGENEPGNINIFSGDGSINIGSDNGNTRIGGWTNRSPNVDEDEGLILGESIDLDYELVRTRTVWLGAGFTETNPAANNYTSNTYIFANNTIRIGNTSSNITTETVLIDAEDIVFNGTADLGNVENVVIDGGTDGYVLSTDGSGNLSWVQNASQDLEEIIAATNEPTGFPDPERTQTAISFDEGNRQFTIEPTGSSFDVWVQGTKYTKSISETVTIDDTDGLWYISYDGDGKLQALQTFYDWANVAPVSYVYWDSANSVQHYFADERHGSVMDWATHEYLHRTRGAAIANGFDISGSLDFGGSQDIDAQIGMTGGTFFDEDIELNLVGNAVPLSTAILYRSGTIWFKDPETAFPYKAGTARSQYNLNTNGNWSTVDISNGSYGVNYVCATNDVNTPFIVILGQNEYNNVTAAREASFNDLNLDGLPSIEFRVLYKLIFRTANIYTNQLATAQREFVDLREFFGFGGAGVGGAAGVDNSIQVNSGGQLTGYANFQYLDDAFGTNFLTIGAGNNLVGMSINNFENTGTLLSNQDLFIITGDTDNDIAGNFVITNSDIQITSGNASYDATITVTPVGSALELITADNNDDGVNVGDIELRAGNSLSGNNTGGDVKLYPGYGVGEFSGGGDVLIRAGEQYEVTDADNADPGRVEIRAYPAYEGNRTNEGNAIRDGQNGGILELTSAYGMNITTGRVLGDLTSDGGSRGTLEVSSVGDMSIGAGDEDASNGANINMSAISNVTIAGGDQISLQSSNLIANITGNIELGEATVSASNVSVTSDNFNIDSEVGVVGSLGVTGILGVLGNLLVTGGDEISLESSNLIANITGSSTLELGEATVSASNVSVTSDNFNVTSEVNIAGNLDVTQQVLGNGWSIDGASNANVYISKSTDGDIILRNQANGDINTVTADGNISLTSGNGGGSFGGVSIRHDPGVVSRTNVSTDEFDLRISNQSNVFLATGFEIVANGTQGDNQLNVTNSSMDWTYQGPTQNATFDLNSHFYGFEQGGAVNTSTDGTVRVGRAEIIDFGAAGERISTVVANTTAGIDLRVRGGDTLDTGNTGVVAGDLRLEGGYALGNSSIGGNVLIDSGANVNGNGTGDVLIGTLSGRGNVAIGQSAGQITFNAPAVNFSTAVYTVANLPGAGNVGVGGRAFVSDSNVTAAGNFGNAVFGGGANGSPVYSDGLNWRIG